MASGSEGFKGINSARKGKSKAGKRKLPRMNSSQGNLPF